MKISLEYPTVSESQEGLTDDQDKPQGRRSELGGIPIHQIWDNLGIEINNDGTMLGPEINNDGTRPKPTKQYSKPYDPVDLNK